MRTITYNAYTFDELSDEAKEKAIIAAREKERYWSMDCNVSDAVNSVKEAAATFDLELSDWSIGPDVSQARIKVYSRSMDDNNISGVRLRTYIVNNYHHVFYVHKEYEKKQEGLSYYEQMNLPEVARVSNILYEETCCPFTGVCYDESIMDVFRAFLKEPYEATLAELFENAVIKLCKELSSEEEYMQSDEGIVDYLLCNEVEFTAEGKLL